MDIEINTSITIDKIKIIKHLIEVNMNRVLKLELEFDPTSNLFFKLKKQYINIIKDSFKILKELTNRLESENNLYLEKIMNLLN